MKLFGKILFAASAAAALSACYFDMTELRLETAKRLAAPNFMLERHINASPFVLTAFERVHDKGGDATVYIEGDGVAWVSRQQPSLDPTPRNPVALNLSAQDNGPNVIYLARACQYTKLTTPGPCPMAYWTSKRFAPEVIAAENAALDDIKRTYDIKKFNLVGFSGGAAVAVLAAAKRSDVASIRTVAGNLDHVRVNANHGVSQMTGSLNAVDVAPQVANIPQHHFIGSDDTVVTPDIFQSFRNASGPSKCIRSSIVRDATHESGWVDIWPTLLKSPLDCNQ
jgi:hypothetical protein